MLTLFATPKAFVGLSAILQRNAIGSWRNLGPSCEIILFGDEDGTGSVADEFDATHILDTNTPMNGN